MKVGIIIVTYNSQKDIGRLLDSITIQNYNNLEVYVVDNNSADQTLNIVQDYESRLSIRLIPSLINHGFARGNNIGIKKAIDEGCELLFILNPDIQLEHNCIDILAKRLKKEERVGVVGPVVLFGNEPGNIIQGYGVKANFKTQKKFDGLGHEKWSTDLPVEIYCDFVLGGAMMIRSDLLKITGLFEEDYFMYNDELDLAYRVKKAGYKTLCLRDAIVRHYHNFNVKNKAGNNLMYYYITRNKYLYFKKFRLYSNFIIAVINEFFNFPRKILWSVRKMKNLRILKFYYIGFLDGILGKTGKVEKSF